MKNWQRWVIDLVIIACAVVTWWIVFQMFR